MNGRISSRSFRRYRLTRFFWRPFLQTLDAVGAISVRDAERLIAIGVDEESVTVVGNAKYDGFAARTSPALRQSIATRLGIRDGERLLVAASTHDGEEQIVLSVYERLRTVEPDMSLILVPRHVDRADSVADLARARGFDDLIRLTDIDAGCERRDERIILIDTIGELFKVYSLATVVFCGGSLVPRGGQNILEPAAWGAVICYGPSMDDFYDESRLLESVGAAVRVSDEEDLYRTLRWFLEDDDERRARGLRDREAIMMNNGSSAVYAEMIHAAAERSCSIRGRQEERDVS